MKHEKIQTIGSIFEIIAGFFLIFSLFSPKAFDNSNIEFFLLIASCLRLELLLFIVVLIVFTKKNLRNWIKGILKNNLTNIYSNIPIGKSYLWLKNIITIIFVLLSLLFVINSAIVIKVRFKYYANFPEVLENKLLKKAISLEKSFRFVDALLKFNYILDHFQEPKHQLYIEKQIQTLKNQIKISNILFKKLNNNQNSKFKRVEFAQLLNSYSLNPGNEEIKISITTHYKTLSSIIDSLPALYQLTNNNDTVRLKVFFSNNGWVYFEKDIYDKLISSEKEILPFCKKIIMNNNIEDFKKDIVNSWFITINSVFLDNLSHEFITPLYIGS